MCRDLRFDAISDGVGLDDYPGIPMSCRFPPRKEHILAVSPTIIPLDESHRMAAVKRYEILDTPADGAFDRVTAIAARRFNVPIAIISIVDYDRIWFKSHHGLSVQQIDRKPGLCASAILRTDPHILTDASKDVRSLANPLVAGDFGLRFYAGVPLRTSDGYNLGTLCVIDKEPRPITQDQIEDLKDLASLVMDQLEFRLSALRALAKADKSLMQAKLLAREIDHRVMNSLQFVAAMLRLQGKKASGGEAAAEIDAAASRVAAVARVHRHFHLEEDTANVPAITYLRRLCDDLSSILGVTVEVDGENGLLPTTSIQPVGLIVNELVINAAKHGAGQVNVTYRCNGVCKITVCDEGPGLPAGFNPATNVAGLGMKIADVLAKQLGGSFAAGANPAGKGACFTVTFTN
jgi:two-component sensor histidine kinase